MQTRSLAVVALLTVFGAAAVWLLTTGLDGSADAPPGDLSGAVDARPDGSGVALESTAARAEDASERATPARIAAPGEVAGALAMVGRVVDPAGRAIPGALVSGRAADDAMDPTAFLDDLQETGDLSETLAEIRDSRHRSSATTDVDGRFRLVLPDDAQPGPGVVAIRARGFLPVSRRVELPAAGEDGDLGTVTLKRGGILAGRVVDGAGRGIPAARVTVVETDTPQWLEALQVGDGDDEDGEATDAEGRFELAQVKPGSWHLSVKHPDHPPERLENLKVAAGEAIEDLVVILQTGASISGRILGMPAGAKLRVAVRDLSEGSQMEGPMALLLPDPEELLDGMPFLVGSRTAAVDPDGSFVLRGLENARKYRLWAAQTAQNALAMSPCTPRIDVLAGTQGVELPYEAGISVTFAVVDARTGQPVERLTVKPRLTGKSRGFGELFANIGSGRTDDYPGGLVTLSHLRPAEDQTLKLEVKAVGYADFDRSEIDLPRQGTLDLGTLRLEPVPLVRVQVTAAHSGEPVVGAEVRLQRVEPKKQDTGSGGSFTISYSTTTKVETPDGGSMVFMDASDGSIGKTDVRGVCELSSLPGERVTIFVQGEVFAPHESGEITLPMADDFTHDVGLLESAHVVVHVVDRQGEPVSKERVERQPDHRGVTDSVMSDEMGIARFGDLPAGAHEFRLVSRWGGGDSEEESGGFTKRITMDSGSSSGGRWEPLHLAAGQSAELTLVVPPTARLVGVVRENGAALAGAQVAFSEGRQPDPEEELAREAMMIFGAGGETSQKADADGAFEFAKLPVGEHQLRVRHPDRAMSSMLDIVLAEGENVLDVDLDVAVVRGRVLGPDGAPLRGAQVTIAVAAGDAEKRAKMGAAMDAMAALGMGGSPRGVRTGADGVFELRGVRTDAPVLVSAQARRHVPATAAPIRVAIGALVDGVQIQLERAGRVSVRVADRAMLQGVEATYLGTRENVAPVYGMMRGSRTTLDGLCPGRWRIELQRMGDTAEEMREVDIVAGETLVVEF